MTPLKIHFQTLGCRLNEAEIGRWQREVIAAGHQVMSVPDEADAIVLNSCAVTAGAAKSSRQLARKMGRSFPQAKLILTGCYATLEPERLADELSVDRIVLNQDKERLVSIILDDLAPGFTPRTALEPDSEHVFAERRTRAFVKVQDGCRNRCTFCIVTIARGAERSRTIDEIVDEVKVLVQSGYKEVVLTGVHLGGYGADIGEDLVAMLRAVLDRTTVQRVRMGSLEPWGLPEGFFELFMNPRLCPHLHLPIQSGSDRILKRMARRCKVAEFVALVDEARRVSPLFNITTDIICGFPGETEDDHLKTLELLRRASFGHVHTFGYSPREGTAAQRMSGRLPKEVIRRRSAEVRSLAEALRLKRVALYVGQHDEILWEKRHAETRWHGYTRHYLQAELIGEEASELRNQISTIKIIGSGETRELCCERL